jgi:hypothetical protein
LDHLIGEPLRFGPYEGHPQDHSLCCSLTACLPDCETPTIEAAWENK